MANGTTGYALDPELQRRLDEILSGIPSGDVSYQQAAQDVPFWRLALAGMGGINPVSLVQERQAELQGEAAHKRQLAVTKAEFLLRELGEDVSAKRKSRTDFIERLRDTAGPTISGLAQFAPGYAAKVTPQVMQRGILGIPEKARARLFYRQRLEGAKGQAGEFLQGLTGIEGGVPRLSLFTDQELTLQIQDGLSKLREVAPDKAAKIERDLRAAHQASKGQLNRERLEVALNEVNDEFDVLQLELFLDAAPQDLKPGIQAAIESYRSKKQMDEMEDIFADVDKAVGLLGQPNKRHEAIEAARSPATRLGYGTPQEFLLNEVLRPPTFGPDGLPVSGRFYNPEVESAFEKATTAAQGEEEKARLSLQEQQQAARLRKQENLAVGSLESDWRRMIELKVDEELSKADVYQQAFDPETLSLRKAWTATSLVQSIGEIGEFFGGAQTSSIPLPSPVRKERMDPLVQKMRVYANQRAKARAILETVKGYLDQGELDPFDIVSLLDKGASIDEEKMDSELQKDVLVLPDDLKNELLNYVTRPLDKKEPSYWESTKDLWKGLGLSGLLPPGTSSSVRLRRE